MHNCHGTLHVVTEHVYPALLDFAPSCSVMIYIELGQQYQELPGVGIQESRDLQSVNTSLHYHYLNCFESGPQVIHGFGQH